MTKTSLHRAVDYLVKLSRSTETGRKRDSTRENEPAYNSRDGEHGARTVNPDELMDALPPDLVDALLAAPAATLHGQRFVFNIANATINIAAASGELPGAKSEAADPRPQPARA